MKRKNLFNLIKKLWPICRSITGRGLKQSLDILKSNLPKSYQKNFKIFEVKSGTKIYDWVVPDEWIIKDAYIKFKGKKIIDFKKNNLHLVNYSYPVNKKKISLNKIKNYLYTEKKTPNAIPYVTSYYNKKVGMCISYKNYKKLKKGNYDIMIETAFKKGNTYIGEYFKKGKSKKEIFFSTYLCHPSLANDNLSGPVVALKLAEWITKEFSKNTKYSYRFVFGPETLGAIYYINKNIKKLKKNVKYAFNLTCLGGSKQFSFLPSRTGLTITDKLTKNILTHEYKNFLNFSFLDRGSDERQYCNPNVNLPMVSVMQKKYHEYPQYHNSLDNLSFINNNQLENSLELYKKLIIAIENNFTFKNTLFCEPPLKKYFPELSKNKLQKKSKIIMDMLIFADGKNSLLDIADKINISILSLIPLVKKLKDKKFIKIL